MPDCSVCEMKDASRLTKQVYLGRMTSAEAARQLGVPESTLWNHLKHAKLSEDEAASVSDLTQVLREVMDKLKDRCDTLLAVPVNPANERPIATQVRLLKDVIMDVAKLEHRISEVPSIQIQNIMMQHTELTQFLIKTLCTSCNGKLLTHLEHTQSAT